jgi:uncharacterized membrane protein
MMNTTQIGLALASVVLIAFGQLLFKAVGLASAAAGTLMHPRALALVCAAGVLYVAATLAWIWLLRTAPLSRAYPYMALSFVLVPAMSAVFFREALSAQYMIGIALVIAGIVVATLDAGG